MPPFPVSARPRQPAQSSAQLSVRGQISAIAVAGLCAAVGLSLAPPAAAAPVDVTARIDGARRTLDTLAPRMQATVESYNSARLTLAVAERRATTATASAERARRAYLVKRRLLSGYAAAAYRSGPDGALTAMITSTPAEYLDRLATLDAVAHGQSETVSSVAATREHYTAQQAGLEAAARAASQVTQGIAFTKSSIEAQIARQRAALAALTAERGRLRVLAARGRAARHGAAAAAAQAQVRRIDTITDPLTAAARATKPASSPRPLPTVRASGRARIAVAAAYSVLGRPYAYGAAGPRRFDCSGLTMWSWAHAGVSLPHSSRGQYGSPRRVSTSALQPGDLLFFYRPVSHVGMYIGGGRMIAAPHTGDVVKISTPRWGSVVRAARPG